MDERDRHIVTFDSDEDLEFEYGSQAPVDVEPEVHPYNEATSGDEPKRAEFSWDRSAHAADESQSDSKYRSSEHIAPQTPVTEEEAEYLTERDKIYGMDDNTGETWRYRDEHMDPERNEPGVTSHEAEGSDGSAPAPDPDSFTGPEQAASQPDRESGAGIDVSYTDGDDGGSIDTSYADMGDDGSGSIGASSDDGASGGNDNGGPGDNGYQAAHSHGGDGSGYVTRKMLAVCLVITMLASTLFGAIAGSALGRRSGSDQAVSGNTGEQNSQGGDEDLSTKSLADATDSEMTLSQIVKKNEDAVVEILVSSTSQDFFGQYQVSEGAGSGVIVRSNGFIVTNYHVIEGANKVQVTLHNGDTYPAVIVGGDSENDIAVIKIEASDLTIADIGDSDTVSVGDTAVAIGNPLGQLGGTATAGIISALDRKISIDGNTLTLLQTDAAINGGNSGGGLFNSKGQLIGIVDAKSSGVGIEGLAFAIPINSVKDIINDLVENGKVSAKPAIGIMIQNVSEDNAQYYNLESAGVYVAQVTGENAEKAGFQQGDRIISFNGEKITDSEDLIAKVRKCKVGDNVSVVVSRSGQEMEIRTVLEATTVEE